MSDEACRLLRQLTGSGLDDPGLVRALETVVDVCGGLQSLRTGDAGVPGPTSGRVATPDDAGMPGGGEESGGHQRTAADLMTFDSVASIGQRYRAGDLTPSDLVAAMIERIREVDPDVRAWSWVDEHGAREQADRATRELARGIDRGPLHGIPVGVKDLIDVAGLPCTAGSHQFEDRVAASDAGCIVRLRTAGAVVLGKTNTHEFAFGGTTPPTRNPWTVNRIPGGSSGGSGAALATGTCTLALGTDTAGSVRIPSALCGVSGLMPSGDRMTLRGVVPLAPSLDMVGPMARSVDDVAYAMDALAAVAPPATMVPGLSQGVAGMRLGVLRDLFEPAQPGVLHSVAQGLDVLGEMGAEMVEVRPRWIEQSVVVAWIVMLSEAVVYHAELLRSSPDKYDPDVRALLESGQFVPAAAYVRAREVMTLLAGELRELFKTVDALVLPTMPCTAAPYGASRSEVIDLGGEMTSLAHAHVRNTAPFNLARLPAGSQPCGVDGSGLPVGLQVVGPDGDEAVVLRVMHAVEAAGLAPSRPPSFAPTGA